MKKRNACSCMLPRALMSFLLVFCVSFQGVGLHPKLTAYFWKWEPDDFVFREMPQEIFERRNELFSPDEPFCVLEQGRADFVRIRACDEYIPPDTSKWFRSGNFQDYFAFFSIQYLYNLKGGLFK